VKKNIFEDRKERLKVGNKITGDDSDIFFIHGNGRSAPKFFDIEAGMIAISIIF
jgi:hypothetical protein